MPRDARCRRSYTDRQPPTTGATDATGTMIDEGPSPHRLNELLAKTTRAAYAASAVGGPDVFGRLTEQLADILGVAVTMIATQVADRPGFMLARATWLDGQPQPPFEYDVQHTPCRSMVGRQSRFVASGLHGEFAPGTMFHEHGLDSYAARSLLDGSGRQLGLIVAADRAPMSDAAVTEAVLQIFAVRASAELERERSQAALQASEASYRSIFQANEDAIFVHDWASGAILDVSPKASELYGHPREALQRMRVGDLSINLPPYTDQDATARIEEAKRRPGPVRFEWRARHRDGHLMWNEVTLKRAKIAGEPRVLAFVRDVTEQRRAEEAVRASEEQYRAIFNASADALILWDSRFLRVDVNPAYERIFGWSREEVIGRGYEHPQFGADYVRPRQELVRRALAGEACHAELESIRRDGARILTEVHAVPFRHRGEPHVLAIVRDITERRRVEELLRASEEQYRVIFDGSADAVALWDREVRIVDVNAAFTAMYRYTRDEVVGKSYSDNIPRDEVDKRLAVFRRALAGVPGQLETVGVKGDGEHFEVELRFLPIDYRGEPHVLVIGRDITERKKVENALRASEEQYRAIFNASADAMMLWDSRLQRVDVNPAHRMIFGFDRDEVVGRAFEGLPYPEEYSRPRIEMVRRALAGETIKSEMEAIRKDGRHIFTEMRTIPFIHRGEPHVLQIARDITERKTAEDRLRSSEEQYREIFNATDDALVLRDADFRIVDVNAAYEAMSGRRRAEMVGISELTLTRHATAIDRRALHAEALAGRTVHFEAEGQRDDGQPFVLEVRGIPMIYGGEPHVLYIGRDATERKRAEAALRASEEQYRAIFNASADALVLRDADFRIVDVNATYEAMSGRSRDEVLGVDRVLANPPEVGEAIRALHCKALAGEPIVFETQLVRRDGTRYDLELRGVPIQHRGAPHVLYMGRDITARRSAEDQQRELQAQLRQVQKMEAIGQLTGGIAHDFNNILASIMGYVGLALERPATSADGRLVEYLQQAENGCRRARDLIQQMLAFSRGRRGERQALPLAALLEESLRLLRATFPSSIALEVESADEAAVAEVDPVQLQQVLLNIGINARDAIGAGGRIRFGVRRGEEVALVCASCGQSFGGKFHRLWVADSGPGIPASLRRRMFEPFFSTKAPGRGTGMGLATVHRIVHDHGGHLLVEADQGARFDVLLPAEAVTAAPRPAGEAAPAPGRTLLAGRVLLVDDEESVLGFMRELLQSWGLDVVAVRQAQAARDLLAGDGVRLDLLLTDQTMPGLSGVDLAHAARSLRPGLPVLLYSGHADLIDVEALKQAGIRSVLRKPLELAQLRAAIEDCLAGR
jgi:PAS domain S-box-containing protein